jgi:hypothetical protein
MRYIRHHNKSAVPIKWAYRDSSPSNLSYFRFSCYRPLVNRSREFQYGKIRPYHSAYGKRLRLRQKKVEWSKVN